MTPPFNPLSWPGTMDWYGTNRIMSFVEAFPNKGSIHVRYRQWYPSGDRGWLDITCFDWRQ